MPAPAAAALGGAAARSRTGRFLGLAAIGSVVLVFLLVLSFVAGLSGVSVLQGTAGPSSAALADIPPEYLRLYRQAGSEYGIDWAVLAAIGKIETDHGRLNAPGVTSGVNSYGCCAGPMQFYVVGANSTWAAYGVDGNRDGRKDVYDPADAIPAAARYLRASGAPGDYERAIYAYNHADWYVADVLAQAERYRAAEAAGNISVGSANAGEVLDNPRISLTPVQRDDLASGRIDARVIGLLAYAAETHTLSVSSLRSDHGKFTTSGNVSNHWHGRAVDISIVDGEPCDGSERGACGQLAVELGRIEGRFRAPELIYCFDPDGGGPGFAAADHCDHIHAGFGD